MPAPGCVRPVCFTRSAPFDICPGQLVLYEVIDTNVTSRCSVLSTIAEAGGEARLPDAITLADFQIWIAFVKGHCEHDDLADGFTVVKVTLVLDVCVRSNSRRRCRRWQRLENDRSAGVDESVSRCIRSKP